MVYKSTFTELLTKLLNIKRVAMYAIVKLVITTSEILSTRSEKNNLATCRVVARLKI